MKIKIKNSQIAHFLSSSENVIKLKMSINSKIEFRKFFKLLIDHSEILEKQKNDELNYLYPNGLTQEAEMELIKNGDIDYLNLVTEMNNLYNSINEFELNISETEIKNILNQETQEDLSLVFMIIMESY